MNKQDKNQAIEALKEKFSQYNNFYITNTESLTVAQVSKLRRICFDKNVELKVAKNTLIRKAMEQLDSDRFKGAFDSLHGVTALMFAESAKDSVPCEECHQRPECRWQTRQSGEGPGGSSELRSLLWVPKESRGMTTLKCIFFKPAVGSAI